MLVTFPPQPWEADTKEDNFENEAASRDLTLVFLLPVTSIHADTIGRRVSRVVYSIPTILSLG